MKKSAVLVSLCCALWLQTYGNTIQHNNTCGLGTILDSDTGICACDKHSACEQERVLQNGPGVVQLAGVFDVAAFDWGRELLDFTVLLINDHSDGWHDDIFDDGTILEWKLADSTCDATKATRAYWDIRTELGGIPPHGIIGCRCSSASIAVARISGLESVPQISMASTSDQLSDTYEFPFFSRTVGPDNERGQVGAIVSMLNHFEWDRVNIIMTDTSYGKDLATQVQQTWQGEVTYSGTVVLNADNNVNIDSVQQVLDRVPAKDSRIILLFAHSDHAYPILQTATEMNFQPDSIWVGVDGWVNRLPPDVDYSKLMPGYLGITPYRNRNSAYQDYLFRLNNFRAQQGKGELEELPDYAAEQMADSIVVLAKAISMTPKQFRRNGALVTRTLRDIRLDDGVSGEVSFTPEGERNNLLYSIFNMRYESTGDLEWVNVGETGTESGSTILKLSDVCFADVGCGLRMAPLARYPIPPQKLPIWVTVALPVTIALLCFFFFKYWRTHRKKQALKTNISEIQKKMEAMKKIDSELLGVTDEVEAAKRRQESLIAARAQLQEKPETWTDTDQILVPVPPDNQQYWLVSDRLRKDMNDAHISGLWRVQNTPLWTYYSFHKDRLSMIGINHNEQSAWHGTSSLDPAIIYNDKQDGFMMQFSREGFWGRGIYFADKSSYSHNYSYKPEQRASLFFAGDERPGAKNGEREMFLAKLLRGNEIFMDRNENDQKAAECRALTVPPSDAESGLKYNTVTGNTGGSQVWIVYENGRAYPDYLVRYYRGKRDPKRTPYESRQESTKNFMKNAKTTNGAGSGVGPEDGVCDYVWEYLDDNGWKPYSLEHQKILSAAYVELSTDKTSQATKVQIKSDFWSYEVDLETMSQTNLQHPGRRQRDVRRTPAPRKRKAS